MSKTGLCWAAASSPAHCWLSPMTAPRATSHRCSQDQRQRYQSGSCINRPPGGALASWNLDALRRQQTEASIRAGGQPVNEKICRLVVGRLHDRRGRRDDPQGTARTDPVDVAVAVHGHGSPAQPLQLPNEPAAVDQCGADPLRKRARRPRDIRRDGGAGPGSNARAETARRPQAVSRPARSRQSPARW